MSRRNILILEPDRDIGELFARALEARRDFKCYMAPTEGEGMDLLKDIPFGLVLIDMSMAMAADFSLLKKITRMVPETTIIIDAYLHQQQHMRQCMALGAHGCVIKPIKIDAFRKQIDSFCVNDQHAQL